MQLLEDKHIIDSGDMAERIAVLREKVQKLLENHDVSAPVGVNSKYNDELLAENLLLKKQIEEKSEGISTVEHNKIVAENVSLKKQVLDNSDRTSAVILQKVEEENAKLKQEIAELNTSKRLAGNDNVLQENIMLKKQLVNREKTIKELDFKLEMFKLAKSLREGGGESTKSEELKKIITEYIKEIDKSIASLNIE